MLGIDSEHSRVSPTRVNHHYCQPLPSSPSNGRGGARVRDLLLRDASMELARLKGSTLPATSVQLARLKGFTFPAAGVQLARLKGFTFRATDAQLVRSG